MADCGELPNLPGCQCRFDIVYERRPSQAAKRHRFDCTFRSAKLRSVESTAAANGDFLAWAGAATDIMKNKQLKPVVCATSAGCLYDFRPEKTLSSLSEVPGLGGELRNRFDRHIG